MIYIYVDKTYDDDAFFVPVCEEFGKMFDHSFPACAFLFCFVKLEVSLRTLIPLFDARISPQWLSELRRLWPNVPWQVACELVSG